MQFIRNEHSIELIPETIEEYIDLVEKTEPAMKFPPLGTLFPHIRNWILEYWEFTKFVEHGNEPGIGDLFHDEFVEKVFRFFTSSTWNLEDWDCWEYLSEGIDTIQSRMLKAYAEIIKEYATEYYESH